MAIPLSSGVTSNGLGAKRAWEDEISSGRFSRSTSAFVDTIDQSSDLFPPELGRYHLYLAKACPWANRIEILIRLLGLQDMFSLTFVDPVFAMIGEGRTGWVFTEEYPDTLNQKSSLYEVYVKYHPNYEGKATTPMLLDKKLGQIVCNESREIMRSICWGCKDFHSPGSKDYYPAEHRVAIDNWMDRVYEPLLNGVYKCGFTKDQEAYDQQIDEMFSCLDALDEHLARNKWMMGNEFSVLDLVVGVTLIRFDAIYYTHFLCCKKHIYEFENLSHYTRAFYQIQEVKAATDLDSCRQHYFKSHAIIAPMRIVAVANTNADLTCPHNRDYKFPSTDKGMAALQ